ncbi:hypothetical protein [Caldimonas tepidiphila]|uniref:hypothetical protein n=1 Tax=Caldimonas tepidiphila TaxID=2315841 RepID=UPI000E5A3E3A|nr:hypothetical protein [Caldimonas tepidiphila]
MILAAGLALLVLGLVCGAVLVVAPFGLNAAAAGATLWVLFPLFVIAGYMMFVVLASASRIRAVSRAAGTSLVTLALMSAAGLVLEATALANADTGSLWYVLVVGLALGSTALLSHQTPEDGG